MAQLTEADVTSAEKALVAAKKASHDARGSAAKRDAYQASAEKLADVRQRFRQQELDAGRRGAGVVAGDAVQEA